MKIKIFAAALLLPLMLSCRAAEKNEALSKYPLEGVTVCLDPGHGKFEKRYNEPIAPGSAETKPAFVEGTAGSLCSEAEINLEVGLLLRARLEALGARVVMTRENEYAALGNIERARLAADCGADMTIRLHADGSEDETRHGMSVLVPGSRYIKDTELIAKSRYLGRLLLDCTAAAAEAESLGIAVREDLSGFNWAEVPTVLIEMGFMTNPNEEELLADPAYRERIADGAVDAILKYTGTE